MFEAKQHKAARTKVPVSIQLPDGAILECKVFVAPNGRVSDLLNDERDFLPIETADGFLALSKSRIMQLKLRGPEPNRPRNEEPGYRRNAADTGFRRPADAWSSDPYEVLGVTEDAPWEVVRAAYLARLKTAHPDRLRSMGVDASLIDAGKELSQRLNGAYATISAKRKGAA